MDNRRWEPATAVTSAMFSVSTDLVNNASGIFLDPYTQYKRSQSELTVAGPSKPRRTSSSVSLDPNDKPLPKLPAYPESSAKKMMQESNSESHQDTNDLDSVSRSLSQQDPNEPKLRKGNGWRTAGSMAGASAKSMGNLMGDYTKGVIVDIPLAATNGFREIPKLYGEDVPELRKITDMKSGTIAAGENFVVGMYEGMTDLFTLPHKGRKEEGMLGVGKGVAKGLASLAFKPTYATVGLFAYTGQGIAKSIHTMVNGSTAKTIVDAKKMEMMWLGQNEVVDSDAVIQDFERLCWKG
jgi:hypothetical protein